MGVKFLKALPLFFIINYASAKPLGEPAIINQAWYLANIQLPQAWALADSSRNITIGVIDMDFDIHQKDMQGIFSLKLSKDFSGYDFTKLTIEGMTTQHGTLVSSIIGANGFNSIGSSGIIRSSTIVALNTPNLEGVSIDIEEVIRYAVDSGVQVINGSFGYWSPSAELLSQLRRGIAYAQEKNVVMVFSAGNFGSNNDVKSSYPANFTTEFDNVISVGASDQKNKRFYASNYGKKTVDVFAPGEKIIVNYGGDNYKLSNGTSEAAPIVTGLVALMKQVNPNLKASEIKKILISTVDKNTDLEKVSVSGGRVNAFRALKASYRY